jgi:hypothetical protein
MTKKPLCKHSTIFGAYTLYCNILGSPVSQEHDCDKCPNYKPVM